MDCVKTSKRPALPPEHQIDWATIEKAPTVAAAVTLAKGEVAELIGTIRTREGRVTAYILEVEGELFACSNDAAWLREWQSKIN